MKLRSCGLIIFLGWVFITGSLQAQTPGPTPPVTSKQAAQWFQEGRSTLDGNVLEAAHRFYFTQAQDGSLRNALLLAQVDHYWALCEDLDHHRDLAKKRVDEAIQYLSQALKQKDGSAVGHAFLCDLYGQEIGLGDMFTGMNVGPQAGKEIKKAMAFAPEDPKVLAAQGRVYLNAPDFAGGDVKKALATFQKVLKMEPKSDENWVWLARTCRKLNDRPGFEEALKKALSLNSKNKLAHLELESWK
jgi:predicted Zn-dependent protease